jgi:hypothetical protein
MNLYTVDLMARERMNDRERDVEAARRAALVRTPGVHSSGWRERLGALAAWSRMIRRGAAI